MDRSLQSLIKRMPPIAGQRHTNVKWDQLEEQVGITYPDSFKEFVSVYGSSHWFDKLLPFYSCADTMQDVQEFLKAVRSKLHSLGGNMFDVNYRKLELPLYPENGGLFPFMSDIDGPEYCWLTDSTNPDRWPVYCWMMGQVKVLSDMTISGMLLGFLERSPEMIQLWGDIRDFDPQRIRIDDVCADA